jgi:hypothetical protein
MDIREFQKNRACFPQAELLKHEGKWVAFSADGHRIVASHDDIGVLIDLVIEAGEDPGQVGLERVEAADFYLGAAELS